MNYKQFIEELIALGYRFSVYPNNEKVVVKVSFDPSCFRNDEIVPPKELPQLPYKIFMDYEEYYDYSILIQWTFEINEWPAEPPRQ